MYDLIKMEAFKIILMEISEISVIICEFDSD
jgi:hypothetical protein